ncbi:MAG: hypothetical protein LBH60_09235 [Prevotellaceae bacterium]|jgi:hypothetical protein|nr:hypothetical protein [Prevotellaceae bacterium]
MTDSIQFLTVMLYALICSLSMFFASFPDNTLSGTRAFQSPQRDGCIPDNMATTELRYKDVSKKTGYNSAKKRGCVSKNMFHIKQTVL